MNRSGHAASLPAGGEGRDDDSQTAEECGTVKQWVTAGEPCSAQQRRLAAADWRWRATRARRGDRGHRALRPQPVKTEIRHGRWEWRSVTERCPARVSHAASASRAPRLQAPAVHSRLTSRPPHVDTPDHRNCRRHCSEWPTSTSLAMSCIQGYSKLNCIHPYCMISLHCSPTLYLRPLSTLQ